MDRIRTGLAVGLVALVGTSGCGVALGTQGAADKARRELAPVEEVPDANNPLTGNRGGGRPSSGDPATRPGTQGSATSTTVTTGTTAPLLPGDGAAAGTSGDPTVGSSAGSGPTTPGTTPGTAPLPAGPSPTTRPGASPSIPPASIPGFVPTTQPTLSPLTPAGRPLGAPPRIKSGVIGDAVRLCDLTATFTGALTSVSATWAFSPVGRDVIDELRIASGRMFNAAGPDLSRNLNRLRAPFEALLDSLEGVIGFNARAMIEVFLEDYADELRPIVNTCFDVDPLAV